MSAERSWSRDGASREEAAAEPVLLPLRESRYIEPPPESEANDSIRAGLREVAAQNEAAGLGASIFISPAAWQGKEPPKRNWLVENALLAANVTLLAGDGGIGKSLLLLQLAACAAAGRDWLGLKTQRGRSLIFAAEDVYDELWRRSADVCRAYDIELTDLGESCRLAPFVGQDARLITFERYTYRPQKTVLFDVIQHEARRFGASYIAIDTATATFGGNHLNRTQAFQYIALLRRLSMATGAAVVLTDHPSVGGRADGTGRSGTTGWENAVRAKLYYLKNKLGQRVLRTIKINYGAETPEIPLRYDRGVFVVDAPEPRKPYAD